MIRKATAADRGGILQCLHAAFEPYRAAYTPEAYGDTTLDEESIADRLAKMTVLVAAEDDAVVGTIAWSRVEAQEAHIRGMAVLPRYLGSGVAVQLLEAAEAQARASGCTRVTLDTTAPLQRAIRFYERHGYRPTGKVADFFGMPLYQYHKAL